MTGAIAFIVALGSAGVASAAGATPTFNKDVAPILYRSCIICHRPDESAPMSLITYDTVRPWAAAIKRKVVAREMPPWFADPRASLKFRNDPRLSQEDVDTIVKWVDAGAPRGKDADLPAVPSFASGWHHPSGRPPDFVIYMPQVFEAPAEGQIAYQNFFVKVPFTEEQWVEATEARPDNPAVVHHFAVSIVQAVLVTKRPDAPNGPEAVTANAGPIPAPRAPEVRAPQVLVQPDARFERLRAAAVRNARFVPKGTAAADMFAAYVPGRGFEQYPSGVSRRLVVGPNAYFNFNMHYQATGKPEKDRSMVGIWLAREPVKSEFISLNGAAETLAVGGRKLVAEARAGTTAGPVAIPNIPPYDEDFELTGIKTYTEAATFYNLTPHAHLRAKDWKYVLVYPDGRKQTILSVPKYDFNWQLVYELEAPLKVPAGSTLVVTAHYDNSLKNRLNPAPEKEVFWGEQSWDEMFVPFVGYTLDPCCR